MRRVAISRSDGGVSIMNHRDGEWDIERDIAKWLQNYRITSPLVTVESWVEIDPTLSIARSTRNSIRLVNGRLEVGPA